MIKNALLVIILTLFTTMFAKAQLGQMEMPISHAQWTLSSKKVSDCEYDLFFTVTLDKGWHTFSIHKINGVDLEVFPTQIVFKQSADYTFVGDLTETKPTHEYDATIDKTVMLHYNKVIFLQRIKLNSDSKMKVTGKYEYQVCKESCEKPPYENFSFDLQGTASCKK